MTVPTGQPHALIAPKVPPSIVSSEPSARPGLPRLATDLGDLGDRRQGLAAETECVDPIQVIGLGQLAGGVRLERGHQVLGQHADAVIGHPDQVLAAPFDREVNARGLGVDRVLEQLLHDARRPLDDFPRRDLVHNRRG